MTLADIAVAAALVAAKPINVQCVTDDTAWEAITRDRQLPVNISGFAYFGKNTIWIAPLPCRNLLSDRPSGSALAVLAHEAAHARNVISESRAQCWGLVWVQDLASRFLGVPFFSPESAALLADALEWTRISPAPYNQGCDNFDTSPQLGGI